MSKYKFLDNIVRITISKIYGKNSIIGKKMYASKLTLYYNRAEHLVFFGKKQISYEENLKIKIRNYIKSGELVFDIGANIGQYALFFSELIGDKGCVISFEPDTQNLAYLLFNKYKNNCTNLSVFNEGVGSGIQTYYSLY